MLVLTRKTQERILIGDNITISILKLKGNTVRIGIEAPRDVRIMRGELPTFDETFDVEAGETADSQTPDSQTATSQTGTARDESEQSDEEPTVSELEWKVLKRIAGRRQPCLPVRRCAPAPGAAASPPAMRTTPVAAAPAGLSE